jgi:pimeloyl-ACP methyl ester carboxylesterase
MCRSGLAVLVAVLVLALQACGGTSPTALPGPTEPTQVVPSLRPDTETILEALDAYPCPESDFTCVSLTVPLDHTDPGNAETIEVVFAVLPAGGERQGMFVTAVGGPGGSGLAVADSYTWAFDPAIPEHFDIVFFDQRGVAASGGLQCVAAATAFYRAEWDATTAEGESALAETARAFADACVDEMGRADLLPHLGTEQAVEDLEAFRERMGDDRFWLYGESYGTQLAQTYAAAYPERLAGLILDGPVDLTLSGVEYYSEQSRAFSDVLLMTLQACSADKACAADMGGDAMGAYDTLAARLAQGPLTLEFPLPSGGVAERSLSFADLETAAASYLYSETSRLIFLRALAAAATGDDLVPMARVLYDSLYLDPQTLDPVPDPSYSDAVYYAVECSDYDFGSAEDYLRAGDVMDASIPRLASIFYGDLPCAFWPVDRVDAGRPAPLAAEGIPTLVLVGTADPATPLANAERIVSRLSDGYLITEQGGPHVIFGWGNACVDDLVTAFLVDGEVPPTRQTICDGVVVDAYVPLPALTAADFSDPLEALASVDTEIYYLPEYYYWDLETPRSVGCPFGGVLAFEPSDEGERLTLTECAFTSGFVMTGTGTYNYDEGVFQLEVNITGVAEGSLIYTRADDGALRLSGEYAGEDIELME